MTQNTANILDVEMHDLTWPCDHINDVIPTDALRWLVSSNLTPDTVHAAANQYLVVSKQNRRRNKYTVIGGLIPYLVLLTHGFHEKVKAIHVNIDAAEVGNFILNDIQLHMFSLRICPVSNALRAAVIVKITEGEIQNNIRGIRPHSKLILDRKPDIIKDLSGFDRRAYNRCDTSEIPSVVIKTIEKTLLIKKDKKESTQHGLPLQPRDDN